MFIQRNDCHQSFFFHHLLHAELVATEHINRTEITHTHSETRFDDSNEQCEHITRADKQRAALFSQILVVVKIQK
jgi:hypothetical protein